MRKILLVSHDMSITGAPKVLLWLADFLKKEGYVIDVISMKDGHLIQDFLNKGIKVEYLENNKRTIYKYFSEKQKKYDLIICNTIITYKYVDILQRFNIPVIWYIHETKLLDEYMLNNKDFARIFANFYNIYTVSRYAQQIALKYNKNIKIIPNGIEDNFKDFNYKSKELTFGFIGSIIPVKGIDILISAFIQATKTHPEIKLIIAGNYNSKLGKKLKKLTLDYKNIIWLGEIYNQKKTDFFNEIDILCTPSLDDPCPLTVLEGAMLGKVIITTDKTGSNYMVKEGVNGYITKAGDIDELKEKILKCCNNADKIDSMKKASREIYCELGTIEIQEKHIKKMLEENWNNTPIINNQLKFEKYCFIRKVKGFNNKRTIYFMNKKIFEYKKGN